MIVLETAEALDDLDAVLAVEGLDGIYVGPSDLSLSLGRSGPGRPRPHAGGDLLDHRPAPWPPGCRSGCTPPAAAAQAIRYAEQGATIVTAAVDTSTLIAAVQEQLRLARARG